MSKTRIAVAGAGYIGQAHMGAARASATVTLSAVVDPSPTAKATADAAGVPLVLVSAPAGSGKSTLVAGWAATHPGRVAWLQLEGSDSDPARCLGRLWALSRES